MKIAIKQIFEAYLKKRGNQNVNIEPFIKIAFYLIEKSTQ